MTMTFLSILIALLLERIFPQFIELRRFDWLGDYSRWLVDVLHIERFGAWGSLATLMFPLLLVVWMASGLFENALFGLFGLAFDVAIIFFTLGPRLLDRQVDDYLDAIDIGDENLRRQKAGELGGEISDSGLAGEAREFSRAIFVQANCGIFALLFWFILLGPVAAVFYRILMQMSERDVLDNALNHIQNKLRVLTGWMDWIPTRITLFCYMISGNFDAALQAYRSGAANAVEIDEQNEALLEAVGAGAIGDDGNDAAMTPDTIVKKARGLYLRALVVWLLILLLLGWMFAA